MRKLAPLALLLLIAACGDNPMDPLGPGAGSGMISDANQNSGNEAFFWLAPIVKNNDFAGVFNPRLKPVVEICPLEAGSDPERCDPDAEPLADWAMGDGLTVDVANGHHYGFEWHTDETATDFTATYRIYVYLSASKADTLGYADVQFFSNGSELRNIDTDQVIELRDGRTLPGRFRIEQGVSCNGQADCGEAVIGPEGGTVTTESGFAGVEFPDSAVDGDILITIRQVEDPSTQQPWGRCLPTGLRQVEGCYEFDTEPAIEDVNEQDAFNTEVVVAVCIAPNTEREDRLVLHKYDPEHPGNGVTALEGTAEDFLTCDDFAYDDAGLLGRFARAAGRVLSPVAGLVGAKPLYALDAGRAGLTDAFSFFGWAEPVDLSVVSAPALLEPETAVPTRLGAVTAHNHGSAALAASDHELRFDYTEPGETPTAAVLAALTTDEAGEAEPDWTLTDAVGIHTLAVSTRMQITVDNEPFVVPDPTEVLTVQVGGYSQANACEGEEDCVVAVVGPEGDTIVTEAGYAGVAVPEDAVAGPILIKINRLNPAQQPGGRCLPTGLRQVEGCYEYDTEPSLADVNGEDRFLEDVAVAICIAPDNREDYLTLHKYDPERPDSGVVALEGTAETFLTCDGFGPLPDGPVEELVHAGRRLLSPVMGIVAPRPLFALDAGRAGLTDAFSRIGWAEPVTLTADAVPDGTTPGVTDIVVTAMTAHNHPDHEPAQEATEADQAIIRFEYTDPSMVTHVTEETTGEDGTARIALTTQAGVHNVKVSTRQEILVDSDFAVGGAGGGYGMFAAPNVTVGEMVFQVIRDPTPVVDAPEVTVLGRVSLWSADGDDGPLADAVGPNDGSVAAGAVTTGPGITGNGLVFDGADVVSAGAANFGDATQWTVGAWVNLDPGGDPLAIQRFVTLGPAEKAVLRQEAADETEARKLHVFGRFDGELEHVWEPQGLTAGCWHHVVGVYDGKYLRLYRDGDQVGEAGVGSLDGSEAADALLLGSEDEPLHGTLDEIEVHNRALTADEVMAAYAAVQVPACGIGAVAGQILDPSGLPIVGANIQVEGTDLGTTTDERGRFLLPSVAAGPQALLVTVVGYEPASVPVDVQAGGRIAQDIVLTPLAPEGLVVDGVLSDGEWDDAVVFDPVVVHLPDGGTTEATVLVTNDGESLYIGVRYEVDLSQVATFTALAVRFDDNANNEVECGEDALDAITDGELTDHFWDCASEPPQPQPDTEHDGTNDGATATGFNDTHTVIEVSHPLASGDALDFSLSPRSTVGLVLFTNIELDANLVRTDLLGTFGSDYVPYIVK